MTRILSTPRDYSHIVEQMRQRYDLRINRWRTSMSGCAWRVHHADGTTVNYIEAPPPRTPISLAIFLHEVGHHAIGFQTFRRRCEEEYHVWMWAIAQMREQGVEPDVRVMRRFNLSMRYAVDKAVRRGVKRLPEPLIKFLPQAA